VSRIVAVCLIIAYFFTAVPVLARRHAEAQVGEPAAELDARPTPNSACDLVNPLRDIHAIVIDLAEKAHDAGQFSLNLHRTSRWVGYKHIEVEVRDLEGIAKTTYRTIASLSFSLDALPDDNAKLAAATLASTYQNAVSQIADYGHAALDYERTENAFSKLRTTTTFTYSIPDYWKLRTYWDNITRHHLDERYTEVGDALRSLEIPEHIYARSCAYDREPLRGYRSPCRSPYDNYRHGRKSRGRGPCLQGPACDSTLAPLQTRGKRLDSVNR
jgi:hypothetical protein